jgi:hypothetical protein
MVFLSHRFLSRIGVATTSLLARKAVALEKSLGNTDHS